MSNNNNNNNSDDTEATEIETTRIISKIELKEHSRKHKDPWICVYGKVFRVDEFIDYHPGGTDVIIENAGTDATNVFDNVGHSECAVDRINEMAIGILEE
ncbi:hypothetical protein ABK040_002486 [Willaertia magna]